MVYNGRLRQELAEVLEMDLQIVEIPQSTGALGAALLASYRRVDPSQRNQAGGGTSNSADLIK